MTDRGDFGQELQRVRERRGLTLEELADATKISASLFAGLERGDLSRWPSGIFRRAFVRSYCGAVGVDPEPTLARFLRLFPEGDETAPAMAEVPAGAEPAVASSAAPRLVLDADASAPEAGGHRGSRRLGAAFVDVLLAAAAGLAAGVLVGWPWFWTAAAVVGALGHLVMLPLTGATPGSWLLLPRPQPPVLMPQPAVGQARRRVEAEVAVPTPRRHQSRHAAGARPARARRIQH